ncbi:hypothetical protein AURDEDRAFT_144919 [Auricularia subglabra TFB-10046 SS5]|nr:hypothetical protein AURDEDRAFT_144919 [Auricularia subglabra TFB-10046 SS5]
MFAAPASVKLSRSILARMAARPPSPAISPAMLDPTKRRARDAILQARLLRSVLIYSDSTRRWLAARRGADGSSGTRPYAAPASASLSVAPTFDIVNVLRNATAWCTTVILLRLAVGLVFVKRANERPGNKRRLHLSAGTGTGGQAQPTPASDTGPPQGPTSGRPAGPPVFRPRPKPGHAG